MSKHLARDSSLWNRLIYGPSRVPVDLVQEQFPPEKKEEVTERKPMNFRILGIYAWIVVTAVLAFYEVLKFALPSILNPSLLSSSHGPTRPKVGIVSRAADSFAHQDPVNEIIEVSYPFVPSKRYGQSLYTQLLVNDTFGLWGDPLFGEYSPPSVEFNRVVLTLHVNVSGVQYDRLAHLYVDGAEIWRTSTIEPGGGTVFSVFSKDVSKYLSLFKQDSNVLFQLDNVVNDQNDGKPHVELYADFYFDPTAATDAEFGQVLVNTASNDPRYEYFDIRKPADKVLPLIKEKDPKTPPIDSLSGEKQISFQLPQVSRNTTRLQLDIFASGNGDEEFWYTNVLDKYKDIFGSDNSLLGHGPLRILNVYFDGNKIASQTQQPFIFTGGISPSLWSPVVAINAFDLPSLNVDVSGLLPLLWEVGDHTISFDVSNGLDEVDGGHSGIGEDWITGVNLLTYENKDVVLATGQILHFGNRTRGNLISYGRQQFLLQIVNGILESELTSELSLTLANGQVLNTIASLFTKGEISNVQQYLNLGNTQSVVHTGHNSKSFILTNKFDATDRIHQTNVSLSYPLVLNTKQNGTSDASDLDVSIVYSLATTLDIDEKRVMANAIGQNATSSFHLRSDGNYGDGSLTTRYNIQVDGPSKQFTYKRRVDADHNKITYDEDNHEENTTDWTEINELIEELASINGTANGPLPQLPTVW